MFHFACYSSDPDTPNSPQIKIQNYSSADDRNPMDKCKCILNKCICVLNVKEMCKRIKSSVEFDCNYVSSLKLSVLPAVNLFYIMGTGVADVLVSNAECP